VERGLVVHHEVFTRQRQFDAHVNVPTPRSVAVRDFNDDATPDDAGIEGLEPSGMGTGFGFK
jgi:hypothetical protein